MQPVEEKHCSPSPNNLLMFLLRRSHQGVRIVEETDRCSIFQPAVRRHQPQRLLPGCHGLRKRRQNPLYGWVRSAVLELKRREKLRASMLNGNDFAILLPARGRPGWSPWVVAKLPHAIENGAAVLLRMALHAAMRKERDADLQILFCTIQSAQVRAHTYCCIAAFVL